MFFCGYVRSTKKNDHPQWVVILFGIGIQTIENRADQMQQPGDCCLSQVLTATMPSLSFFGMIMQIDSTPLHKWRLLELLLLFIPQFVIVLNEVPAIKGETVVFQWLLHRTGFDIGIGKRYKELSSVEFDQIKGLIHILN